VLFTTVGFSLLPERFAKELSEKAIFSHTAYNFPALIDVCEKLARQALVRCGGRIEKDADGQEAFVIPVAAPKPSKLELSWAPGPIAGSRFTPDEMAKITEGLGPDLKRFAPGWKLTDCGPDMDPGLRAEWGGKKNVFVTHPRDKNTGCKLSRSVDIPAGKKTHLRLVVGHDPKGDWDLIVKVDGKGLLKESIGNDTAPGGWMEIMVDLSPYAGKQVKLDLVNQASGWSFEAAYWARIAVESK
jgi:hypothetical protein